MCILYSQALPDIRSETATWQIDPKAFRLDTTNDLASYESFDGKKRTVYTCVCHGQRRCPF